MLSTIFSAGIEGSDGFIVTVECNVANRIPAFEIVGLPDNAIREAKDRVKNASYNSGIFFPDQEIMVNLAPADKRKSGSTYDMALLVGILHGAGQAGVADLSKCCFIGELSFSGDIRPACGVLCMCMAARDAGLTEIFVPLDNAAEASVVEEVKVYGVGSINDVLSHISGHKPIAPTRFDRNLFVGVTDSGDMDFSDVRGQERSKRALEVAAAGGHNILFIGPPGTGKSMLAKRLPTIMPPLTLDESIETTKIHSIAGILPAGATLVARRPFRSPHHTMSTASLSGGGTIPRPGEISMAHNGVLFLDELPEFAKPVTEALRQPLEDKCITITRASGHYTFQSNFMLVCAMNPCKCGYYGHPTKECSCKALDIQKYMSKISGPLLDRIDIQVEVGSLTYSQLAEEKTAETSADIRSRVTAAREIAHARFAGAKSTIFANGSMNSRHIQQFCTYGEGAQDMMREAFDSMGLSARGHDKILRIARTIADLAASEVIEMEHIAEAIQMRTLDRKYW